MSETEAFAFKSIYEVLAETPLGTELTAARDQVVEIRDNLAADVTAQVEQQVPPAVQAAIAALTPSSFAALLGLPIADFSDARNSALLAL